jgi:hypothetical protein
MMCFFVCLRFLAQQLFQTVVLVWVTVKLKKVFRQKHQQEKLSTILPVVVVTQLCLLGASCSHACLQSHVGLMIILSFLNTPIVRSLGSTYSGGVDYWPIDIINRPLQCPKELK